MLFCSAPSRSAIFIPSFPWLPVGRTHPNIERLLFGVPLLRIYMTLDSITAGRNSRTVLNSSWSLGNTDGRGDAAPVKDAISKRYSSHKTSTRQTHHDETSMDGCKIILLGDATCGYRTVHHARFGLRRGGHQAQGALHNADGLAASTRMRQTKQHPPPPPKDTIMA